MIVFVYGTLLDPDVLARMSGEPSLPRRLSAYEGSAYALTLVTVATARGALRAQAWIAPAWRADVTHDWP